MNNKGFTLIELTAIVIVLAAIFLVSFPNLINISRSDEEKEYENMVDNLCLAGETYIYNNSTKYNELSKVNSKIFININDLIEYGSIKKNIINPNTEKKVDNNYLEYTVLADNSLSCKYIDYVCIFSKDENKNGLLNIGDMVTCGTESFYVIPDHEQAEENTISLLAKYNLNVGDNKYPNPLTYGIQEENAAGWIAFGVTKYGQEMYSNESYWYDTSTSSIKSIYGTTTPAWVYDHNSVIYQHIENYEEYLISIGVSDLQATVPSYRQVDLLGCNGPVTYLDSCVSLAEKWVYSSSYWLGSEKLKTGDDGTIRPIMYAIGSYEYHTKGNLDGAKYNDDSLGYGVRPVIILPENEYLKKDNSL